jgi:hypothetical protein
MSSIWFAFMLFPKGFLNQWSWFAITLDYSARMIPCMHFVMIPPQSVEAVNMDSVNAVPGLIAMSPIRVTMYLHRPSSPSQPARGLGYFSKMYRGIRWKNLERGLMGEAMRPSPSEFFSVTSTNGNEDAISRFVCHSLVACHD